MGDAELKHTLEAWKAFLARNDLRPRAGAPQLEVTVVARPTERVARFLGASLDRDYDTDELDLPGTLDHCLERGDGLLCHVDIKTGSTKHAHDPYGSWQLRLGSIALWRLAGEPADGVMQGLWYSRDPLRQRFYHAQPADVMAWERELETWQGRALSMRRGETPPVFTRNSANCGLCESRRFCPEWTSNDGKR
jgi:hypothetical protein